MLLFFPSPGITSIKDLKGKTICIGGLLDINRVYLERIMQANGLRNGDYDITVVGNTAGRFAALKSGAVDATMLTPPAIFFAEDAGFRNVGMMLDYTKDLPFSAMDVSLAYARTHRDTKTGPRFMQKASGSRKRHSAISPSGHAKANGWPISTQMSLNSKLAIHLRRKAPTI